MRLGQTMTDIRIVLRTMMKSLWQNGRKLNVLSSGTMVFGVIKAFSLTA